MKNIGALFSIGRYFRSKFNHLWIQFYL